MKKKIISKVINKNFLAKEVYKVLKTNIIEDVLKPGDKINIVNISEELGVSRTPMASALNDLKNDGFVIVKPQHGTFVRKLNREEMDLIYRFRAALEPIVAEIAISKADKNKLCYFKECFLDFNKVESFNLQCLQNFFKIEFDFHSFLESYLPEIVRKDFKNICDLTKRSRLLGLGMEFKQNSVAYIKEKNIDVHVSLINAILDGNLESATKFATEDVIYTKSIIMKYLFSDDNNDLNV